ncbi:MAG: lipopolysaccharide biosynthesis protein [Myxococcales bacterium]|nr:lipopolysaccharide biosynthesis protein [Myxococcales bacterium]
MPRSAGTTIARNSLWLLLDNVGGTVISLVTSVAVARLLGPEKYGHLQYVLWVAAMAKIVGEMGVPLAARKFASEARGRGDMERVASIIRATHRFQVAMAVLIPAAGLGLVFSVVAPEHRLYAALASLSLAPAFLMGVPTSLLWSTENLSFATKASLIGLAVNFIALMTALFVLHLELPGIAAALLLGRTADYLVRRHYYRDEVARLPKNAPRMDPELRRRLVRFCWHQSLLLAIEVVIWNRSEMLFLQYYSTIAQVGFFSQGFNLVQNLMLLPRLLSAAAGATLMVKQGASPKEVGHLGGKAVWVVAVVALPATFGLAALASPALRTLYGIRYVDSIAPLTILGLFGLARALSFPLLEILFATEKQLFVVRWSLAMLVVNLALGFWWIPGGGAVAAAWVKGVTQLFTVIGLWYFAVRHTGLVVPLGRFARLAASGVGMFLAVEAVVAPLHPVAGLCVGIPVGAAVFLVLVKLTRTLAPDDAEFLTKMQGRLPSVIRKPYMRALHWITPAPAPASPG